MIYRLVAYRPLLRTLVFCFLATALFQPAHAAMLGTSSLVQNTGPLPAEMLDQTRAQITRQLLVYGVDETAAQQRVSLLTDEELLQYSSSLQEDPAGGGFLTIAAVVFLVLLATDILGYTDIFPFVNKSANGSRGPVVTEN